MLKLITTKIIFLSLILLGLSACGGGGGGAAQTQSISGGGVKGPLANAIVTVYAYDATQPGFKGSIVATASTNNAAAISGLSIPLNPPYIMEFTSDVSTTDITTNMAPVIATLRTVITQTLVDTAESLYATPLTTMAVDIAIANSNAATTSTQFEVALTAAAAQVVSTVGFGMSGDIDIFDTPPLIDDTTNTTQEQSDVAAYRTAVEALTAIVFAMDVDSASTNSAEAMLTELTNDLADGAIDGMTATGVSAVVGSTLTVLTTTDPSTLTIPNTTTTVADVATILVSEKVTTGSTTSTTDLSNGTIAPVIVVAEPDPDTDADNVLNATDNCPDDANTNQTNTDGLDDGGDVCDNDDDEDGVDDNLDAFPLDPTEIADTDIDGIGDVADNCPNDSNVNQTNTDGDAEGDACDLDDDNDNLADDDEVVLGTNPLLADTDSDGVGDNTDNCPITSNANQTNTDNLLDGGDACDSDDDEDGVSDIQEAINGSNPLLTDTDNDSVGDATDNCPVDSNTNQTNTDGLGDGGDACDTDDDQDGTLDVNDAFPLDPSENTDTDNDGVGDNSDNCPIDANANQADADNDNIGDVCDTNTVTPAVWDQFIWDGNSSWQ